MTDTLKKQTEELAKGAGGLYHRNNTGENLRGKTGRAEGETPESMELYNENKIYKKSQSDERRKF